MKIGVYSLCVSMFSCLILACSLFGCSQQSSEAEKLPEFFGVYAKTKSGKLIEFAPIEPFCYKLRIPPQNNMSDFAESLDVRERAPEHYYSSMCGPQVKLSEIAGFYVYGDYGLEAQAVTQSFSLVTFRQQAPPKNCIVVDGSDTGPGALNPENYVETETAFRLEDGTFRIVSKKPNLFWIVPREHLDIAAQIEDQGIELAAITLIDPATGSRNCFPFRCGLDKGRTASSTLPMAKSDVDSVVSCSNNLKVLGIALKMYSGENKDFFPILPCDGKSLMFSSKTMRAYVSDGSIMRCSEAETPREDRALHGEDDFDDQSYIYTGYVVTNDDDVATFVSAYKSFALAGRAMPDKIEGHGASSKTLYRLREGVERFYITDIDDPASAGKVQGQIPVVIERPENHGGGGNVLFMDGHVEFLAYPGPWPMTEKTISALLSIASLRK